MARTRSPNYPGLNLTEAIDEIRKVHKHDLRNRTSPKAVASHLGYSGLSGPALAKIGALRAYGLLEGRGNDLRVSQDAVTIIADQASSLARQKAIRQAAFRPALFQELNEYFEGQRPSEASLRSELIKRNFTSDAVSRIVKRYLDTLDLVSREGGGYVSPGSELEERPVQAPTPDARTGTPPPVRGNRQAVFPLLEGDVTLTFPSALSSRSATTLASYINLFLEQARQAAEARERVDEELGRDTE
jgi:hypothetical protein